MYSALKNVLKISNSYIGGLKLAPTSEKQIREKIGKKYIEAMAVADKSVVDFHGKDRVSRYVLALMNVVCILVDIHKIVESSTWL